MGLGKGFSGAERTAKLRVNYIYRVLRSGPELQFQVLLKGRSKRRVGSWDVMERTEG